MKIALAQIQPKRGDIKENITTHTKWINEASSKKVDFIFFPELSLTSYEPELAEILAMDSTDLRLNIFQELSNKNKISIGIGVPLKSELGIYIAMLFFQPKIKPIAYRKQFLHADELPYFKEGEEQLIFKIKNKSIAPAICYESIKEHHLRKVIDLKAEIYMASVAKPQKGIAQAYPHYAAMSKKYAIPIIMSNSIGACDNFLSVGQSAIWDKTGELIGKLPHNEEGILIYNSERDALVK